MNIRSANSAGMSNMSLSGRPRAAAVILAVVASGAGQVLLLPPVAAWWLSLVVFVPALWALDGLRGFRAFGAGWLMGASPSLVLGYWIAPTVVNFGGMPWSIGVLAHVAYALVFGAYAGVFAWGLAPLRRMTGRWWPFAAAALWASCEFLNPQMFAHYLGLAFYQRPEIFLVTSVTGIAGVSFLMVLVSAVLFAGLKSRALPVGPALVTLALLVATVGYGTYRGAQIGKAQAAAGTRRIALLQDNLDVAARAVLARRGPTVITDTLVEQSRRALEADPTIEVIVWSEGVLPGSPSDRHNEAVRALARKHGVEVWVGGHSWEGERHYNSAFRVRGDGVVDPPYRKNILVPFGEYLPFGKVFASSQLARRLDRNHPGHEQPVFSSPAGAFSFLICYEAIKSGYVRRLVNRSIDLLVNLTYDAWFGDTSCPHLHLAASAMQSAQYGVPMARVSSTGISAFVDARGIITSSAGLFAPAVLVADVPRVVKRSLYASWGDWFAWSCVGACAALLAAWFRKVARR